MAQSKNLLLVLPVLLSACAPSETHNHYQSPRQNSGFSTVDPGDGGGSTGDGGGGQGVQCNDQAKPEFKNKLFVRDLFEAVHNHGRKLKSVINIKENSEKISAEARSMLTSSLKKFYGPASSRLDFTNEDFWLNFENEKISFIGDDRELVPSRDANSPIALPKNCKLVQIAYWDETAGNGEDGTLYVKKDLWNKLNQLNKIGLLAHEYFFKIARAAKYKNSDSTRYKVGQLLSETALQPLFAEWTPSTDKRVSDVLPLSQAGYKYCEGTSVADPTANIQFFGYEGKNFSQHLVFTKIKSKSINANLLENYSFKIDAIKNDLFAEASNALGLQTLLAEDMISALHILRNMVDTRDLRAEQIRTNGSTRDPFLFVAKRSSDHKKDAWNGNIETPIAPIKLTLHNSAYNPQEDIWMKKIELKSKEELTKLVHQKIKLTLAHCSNVRIPGQHFSAALAVLVTEIKDHIHSGGYPSSFAGWTKALTYFETLVKTKEDLDVLFVEDVDVKKYCQFSKDQNLVTLIPYILYNLEIDNIEEVAIRSLLGDDAYSLDKTNALPSIERVGLPKMTIAQNQSAITYDLNCQNYSGIFFQEIFRKNDFITTHSSKEQSKNFNFSEHIRESDDFEDLKKILNMLITQKSDDSDRSCKGDEKGVFKQNCEHTSLFFNELSHETNIALDECKTLKYRDGSNSCVLMKMQSSQNTYLVRYSPVEEDDQKALSPIISIKLIPNTP